MKAFNGQVCSKAKNADSHKLKVQDLTVNANIKPLYFGPYKLMVYFLPDYTVATETLKTDLNSWVTGTNFRSDVKNQFPNLNVEKTQIIEVPDTYPL